jgi:F-type H+-transporting ATPase subunit epsilon
MALPENLTLEIVTPERKVLSEVVDEVVLPGREGYLGVLPGHTPLLTSLKIGVLEYARGGERHTMSLAWGFAEILPDRVTILAEIAEPAGEIDLDRARARKDEIERRMKEAGPGFDFAAAQESLQKAIVRIDAATGHLRRLPGEAPRRAPRTGRMPRGDEPGGGGK